MTFVLVLAITAVLCVALVDVIREVPWLFYALAVVAVVAMVASVYGVVDGIWRRPIILLVRRCTLAYALFTIVMYIGVLPKDSKLGMKMRTIRAELSVVAWILCMGHMCLYLTHYLTHAPMGAMRVNLLVSFAIAIVLFALLLALGITSLAFVKLRMRARTWKRVQLLAYPFFLLAYVHLMLMLAPSALSGGAAGESAVVGIAVYSVAFVTYVALRLRRCVIDRNAKTALPDDAVDVAKP